MEPHHNYSPSCLSVSDGQCVHGLNCYSLCHTAAQLLIITLSSVLRFPGANPIPLNLITNHNFLLLIILYPGES